MSNFGRGIIVVLVIVGLAIGAYLLFRSDPKELKGVYDVGFWKSATSGILAVESDIQILASSTNRAYATVCNDSAQVMYLGLNQDKAMTGLNHHYRLAVNACLEIDGDNLYWGAIRASSTNGSGNLIVSEYLTY